MDYLVRRKIEHAPWLSLLQKLPPAIAEANEVMNQEDAFNHIMSLVLYTTNNITNLDVANKRKIEFTKEIISNDIFLEESLFKVR